MRYTLKKTVVTSMLIALGLVLPFLTAQIRTIGNMLLPMHLPILLCGAICGWHYGAIAGFITPLLRSALFSMPVFYPNACAMAVELAVYGAVIGLLYGRLRHHPWGIFPSLSAAMLCGRLVWGTVSALLIGSEYTLGVFLTRAFVDALPGILLQFIAIPTILYALRRAQLIHR